MTSFGANIERMDGFNPSFKISGQVYHYLGPLEPAQSRDQKFLQLYFIDNQQEQAQKRMSSNERYGTLKFYIVHELQEMLHQHNKLVRTFKSAKEGMGDRQDLKIVIQAALRKS